MKQVSIFNTTFEIQTQQIVFGEQLEVKGAAGNIYADFFFIHSKEGRVNIASFNSQTGELKEKISGIVSVKN